jgi:hypothetical protein
MKGKKIGSDQDAVGEWSAAKKFEEVGAKSLKGLTKRDF